MDIKIIAARIKQARENRQMTLDEVASRVGCNKSTLSRYENGSVDRPRIPMIESIASALRVDPLWIIGQTDSPELAPDISRIKRELIEAIDGLTDEQCEHLKALVDMVKR